MSMKHNRRTIQERTSAVFDVCKPKKTQILRKLIKVIKSVYKEVHALVSKKEEN